MECSPSLSTTLSLPPLSHLLRGVYPSMMEISSTRGLHHWLRPLDYSPGRTAATRPLAVAEGTLGELGRTHQRASDPVRPHAPRARFFRNSHWKNAANTRRRRP